MLQHDGSSGGDSFSRCVALRGWALQNVQCDGTPQSVTSCVCLEPRARSGVRTAGGDIEDSEQIAEYKKNRISNQYVRKRGGGERRDPFVSCLCVFSGLVSLWHSSRLSSLPVCVRACVCVPRLISDCYGCHKTITDDCMQLSCFVCQQVPSGL